MSDTETLERASSILTGALLEFVVEYNGEERRLPNTAGDVEIDPETGTLSFEVILQEDLSGSWSAFLVDEDGRFTDIGWYDSVAMEVYEQAHALREGEDPQVVYRMHDVAVDASITFPIDDVAFTMLTLTPNGEYGFELD